MACGGKEQVEIPSTILPKEKMAAILVDIHLIEAAMNLNVMNPENASIPNNSSPTIDVLKKNHITKAQYEESFLFYTQHPTLLGEIYQEVLNELSKMQAKVANEK